jgi:peptidylprolyl isomerase
VTAAGSVSDSVKASGDFDSKPTVSFDSPLKVDATERTVAIEGDGEAAVSGARAVVDYSVYNGASGKELTSTSYDGSDQQQFSIGAGQILVGLEKTVACATKGSRVVGVIPPAEAWGETGQTDLGVKGTDSIVFVIDVVDVIPAITAEAYDDMEGMPGVEFDKDGKPTITIPDADPPAQSRLGVIKEGDGDVVPAGANVTVNYTGVTWRDGKVFDSSWDRGEPAQFSTSGVVNAFRAAIEGQKVGSTVVVVAAPIDGYGDTGSGDSIKPGDTLVFVINIISIDG